MRFLPGIPSAPPVSAFVWGGVGGGGAGCYGNGGVREATRDGVHHREEWGQRGVTGNTAPPTPPRFGIPLGVTPPPP